MSITQEFLRHPLWTGAIAASSRQLARAMTADLGLEHARRVVELGPGTGAFTTAILATVPRTAQVTAVELNPRLAAALADRCADRRLRVLRASAVDLAELVDGPVDAVVSGLPWTVLPADQQRRVLDGVVSVLADQGRFTTFAYLHAAWTPPGRRFARELARRFTVVARSPVVWPNLPPAFVHRAAVPRRATATATAADAA
jgi:phospholipid N-methyltransferase